MMKATSAVLTNPRFALAGRHSGTTAAMAFSSRMPFVAANSSRPTKSNNWTDVQDELKDLRHMMTEYKTNQAVPCLDSSVVGQVEDLMSTLAGGPKVIDHDDAFNRVHKLKAVVKDALYYHPQHYQSTSGQQRRLMSTMPQETHVDLDAVRRETADRHWHDVDDEIFQLKRVMEEHKTNLAVDCPHAQLEATVKSNMDEIHRLLNNNADNDWVTHDEAYRRVRLLKNLVKAELYHKEAVNS